MRVGNLLQKKQDEQRLPLLANNLKEVSLPNKTPNKIFNFGGFVESASEMSSQAPAGPDSAQSSPLDARKTKARE